MGFEFWVTGRGLRGLENNNEWNIRQTRFGPVGNPGSKPTLQSPTQNPKLKTQNSKPSSLSPQLSRTLRSCSDRRHDGVAQTARFQNLNSCHGCAPGAGDHFSQLCRVELRITDHLR